ncbi:c-type cytochrome [Halomonas borealis]|uniref:c-type cytochrome n=1 Tax=Halomonas borealis TaxID=2508710 RepID=UPI001F0FCB86|nr:c-type cytochrome [Halomonas borealis]
MNASKWIAGYLAGLSLTGLAFAADDMSHDAIAERLAPVGELCLQGDDCGDGAASSASTSESAATDIDGAAAYGSACTACHDTGAAGAPKMGDAAAWGPRLDKGIETLYDHAINGLNAMPAKGGNPNLSDAQVKAAVDHLVSASQ